MKIQLLSDTHLDQHPFNSRHIEISNEADVVVLAGDISSSLQIFRRFLLDIRKQTEAPVISVLGNHDFYEKDLDASYTRYRKEVENIPDVHILDNDKVPIKEKGFRRTVNFSGCTLWSDFEYGARFEEISEVFFDCKNIFRNGRYLNKEDILSEWKRSYDYLKGSVDLNTVVITHHAPSFLLVPAEFYDSHINGGYFSNCEWVIENKKPLAWLFGHVHRRISAKIGETVCECNPYGTPFERSGYNLENGISYVDKLIIEV
jgi:Icc-related predicted phosphoesterase